MVLGFDRAPAVIKELVEADKASQEAVERRQETRLHRLMNPKAKFAGKAMYVVTWHSCCCCCCLVTHCRAPGLTACHTVSNEV